MYHVSAQCVDERLINVHYYYYVLTGGGRKVIAIRTLIWVMYIGGQIGGSSVPLWTCISQVLRE